MDMIDAPKYVQENHLEAEANRLSIKVGNIYIACWMIYKNISQTEENIIICKKVVDENERREKELFDQLINGGYESEMQ